MYILHLAWRYATCRTVNAVACITIALCVLVQIVVMAVLDGMLIDYKRRIKGLGEQITLYMPQGGVEQATADAVMEAAREVGGVKGATPVLQRYAAVRGSYGRQPVLVRGIDLEAEKRHGALGQDYLLDAESWAGPRRADDAAARDDGMPGVILGAELAQALGISARDVAAGAYVILEYVRHEDEKLVRRHFRVASRFRSGIVYYDRYFLYIPLDEAQAMFAAPGQAPVSYLAVWLDDPTRSEALKDPVAAVADRVLADRGQPHGYAMSAEEAWARAFAGMAHENALMEVVMALISVSSGFAIFAILYTLVAARVRDIGILRSLGASRKGIVATFTLVGLLLGLVGALAGAAGGLALAPNINEVYESLFGTPLYPPHLFGVENMPVHIDMTKVVIRTLAAVLLSVAATFPTALWAGFRQPLEALRHE